LILTHKKHQFLLHAMLYLTAESDVRREMGPGFSDLLQ